MNLRYLYMYALVLIEYSVKSLDKTFIYKIPDSLLGIVTSGMKVKVPFGHQLVNGFVLSITKTCDEDYDIKEISDVVDSDIILNEELLALASYMQEKTLCTKIMSFQTMLPQSLKVKDNASFNKYDVYLNLAFQNHLEMVFPNNPNQK